MEVCAARVVGAGELASEKTTLSLASADRAGLIPGSPPQGESLSARAVSKEIKITCLGRPPRPEPGLGLQATKKRLQRTSCQPLCMEQRA